MDKKMNKNKPDWRRQGQECFLMNKIFIKASYKQYSVGWDHDHCEFCGKKFSTLSTDTQEGYVTKDQYHWVCSGCFNDFRNEFRWEEKKNVETESGPNGANPSSGRPN